MLILLFTVCLAAHQSQCKEVPIWEPNWFDQAGIEHKMTMRRCKSSLDPQVAVAEWLANNPRYLMQPIGWKCRFTAEGRKIPS